MNSNLKKSFVLGVLMFLALVLVHCGQGSQGPEICSGPDCTKVKTSVIDPQVAQIGEGVDETLSFKAMDQIFDRIRPRSGIKRSATITCEDGGVIDSETEGGGGGHLEAIFKGCQQPAYILALPESVCRFSTTLSGTVTCGLTGPYREDPPSGLFATLYDKYEADCSTEAPCSGLTVDLEGEEHVVGLSVKINIWVTGFIEAPESPRGRICIDGKEYDLKDLMGREDIQSDELICEELSPSWVE